MITTIAAAAKASADAAQTAAVSAPVAGDLSDLFVPDEEAAAVVVVSETVVVSVTVVSYCVLLSLSALRDISTSLYDTSAIIASLVVYASSSPS